MAVSHHSHPRPGPSSAVENYVKAIYALQARRDGVVTTTALATRLGVTAASASAMIKKLDTLGIVEHTRYQGVRLTEQGARIALKVIRKHRLLELFLVENLGLPWDRVHREAEVLEHQLSDELTALIAEKPNASEQVSHGQRSDDENDPLPLAERGNDLSVNQFGHSGNPRSLLRSTRDERCQLPSLASLRPTFTSTGTTNGAEVASVSDGPFIVLFELDQKLVPELQPRNRRINTADSAMLTTIEPRHPSRLEKKTNTYRSPLVERARSSLDFSPYPSPAT